VTRNTRGKLTPGIFAIKRVEAMRGLMWLPLQIPPHRGTAHTESRSSRSGLHGSRTEARLQSVALRGSAGRIARSNVARSRRFRGGLRGVPLLTQRATQRALPLFRHAEYLDLDVVVEAVA
jgi:hypothetical protein